MSSYHVTIFSCDSMGGHRNQTAVFEMTWDELHKHGVDEIIKAIWGTTTEPSLDQIQKKNQDKLDIDNAIKGLSKFTREQTIKFGATNTPIVFWKEVFIQKV
jgi:hypothetical protein